MEFTKFKETDYDLVCFGKKHVIVHYGINYDYLKTLSDVDKAEYICNIMAGNHCSSTPSTLLAMDKMLVHKIKWDETLLFELITNYELIAICNDFEQDDCCESNCYVLEEFKREEGKSNDDILNEIKARYPNMNVRWNYIYRGLYLFPDDVVVDVEFAHAYKVKSVDTNRIVPKATLVNTVNQESKMSVNDLVQFTVKVPDEYGETVIGSK